MGVGSGRPHQTDAGRKTVGPVARRIEKPKRLGQALFESCCIPVTFGDHHAKFIATDAGENVSLAPDGTQHLGDILQQGIPDIVALLVVDAFKAVDIQKSEHAIVAKAAHPVKFLLSQQVEAPTIVEPGQFVGDGKPADLLVGFFQRGGAVAYPLLEFRVDLDVLHRNRSRICQRL